MPEKNFRFLPKLKIDDAMKEDTLQSTDRHQQLVLLLPWYLNQSLELAEHQQVENHLKSCILCRRELVNLGKLAAAVKQASDLDVAAEVSFNGLRDKLHTAVHSQQKPELSVVPQTIGTPEKTNIANFRAKKPHHPFQTFIDGNGRSLAIAASLLLATIPFALQYGQSPTTSDYYTLSDAKPDSMAGTQLRVVFSKSMSDTDINALLAQIHGQRVDGPSSVGAYTVKLDSGKNAPELANAVAFLRSQQDVVLAEPILQP